MFRIKICGITSSADALLAAEAGADAIGLNFYPPSPRSLTSEQAGEICQQISGTLQRIVSTKGACVPDNTHSL